MKFNFPAGMAPSGSSNKSGSLPTIPGCDDSSTSAIH